MALDPEFIKKIQEKKAKREALEKKYAGRPKRTSSGRSSSRSSGGPFYRSVSQLTGESVVVSGEEAKKRADKAKYHGS
ncbi:MAG: hypothetical protein MI748_08265 [Opitutales bacterium]|nr:hypothetical protein [Opitutales bacterium]